MRPMPHMRAWDDFEPSTAQRRSPLKHADWIREAEAARLPGDGVKAASRGAGVAAAQDGRWRPRYEDGRWRPRYHPRVMVEVFPRKLAPSTGSSCASPPIRSFGRPRVGPLRQGWVVSLPHTSHETAHPLYGELANAGGSTIEGK
jgi:hypothetical protein